VLNSSPSFDSGRSALRQTGARDGKIKKPPSAAAFRLYIPIFGHEVNENVGQNGLR